MEECVHGRSGQPGFGAAEADYPATASEKQPVVLLIDDVDRLKASDIGLLNQLLRSDDVFLIGTLSESAYAPPIAWRFWEQESLGRLEVAPLDQRGVAELLAVILGGPVELRTRSLLAWLAGGNLAVLRDLVVSAIPSGTLRNCGGFWQVNGEIPPPRSLVRAIESRLGELDADELRLVEVVAHANPLSPAEVERFGEFDCAEGLERKGFLTFDLVPGGGRGLVLPSPVWVEVVRGRTPGLARQRIARELADLEAGRDSAQIDLAKLAAWRADSGGGSAELMLDGAQVAHEAGDLTTATLLVGRSMALRPTFEASLLAANLQILSGQWEEGVAARRRLRDAEVGEQQLFEIGVAEQAIPAFAFMSESSWLPEFHNSASSGVGPAAEFSPVLDRVSAGGIPDCLRPVRNASARSAPEDPWSLLLQSYGHARSGRGSTALRLAQLGKQAHLASEPRPTWRSWALSFVEVEGLREIGKLATAHRAAKSHLADHLPDSDLEPAAWFSWQLSRFCADCGFPRSAADHALTAVALFRRLGRPDMAQLATASLALALAASGDVKESGRLLGALGESHHEGWACEFARSRAWVAAACGDSESARQMLHEGVVHARRYEDVAGEMVLLHSLARIGDARSVVDRLIELAGRSEGDLATARAEHARGLALEDPDLLEAAASRLEVLGAWAPAAEACAAAADIWRRQLNRDRAERAAERGASLRRSCGDPVLLTAAMVTPADSLTRSERTVAEFAVEGLSNKEIAARLSLSQRTVGNHLHQVYRKLGVGSRRELTGVFRPAACAAVVRSLPA
jgi:DNA-binding CsgD family transcriptional regulator